MHSERRGGRLFEALLGEARTCFSAPGFAIFETLVRGWVTAPGRRTITAMICAADPEGRRSHDAYHRFVRVKGHEELPTDGQLFSPGTATTTPRGRPPHSPGTARTIPRGA